jgi:hypothetical protein
MKIVGAACLLDDGRLFSVPAPGRHHDLIPIMCKALNVDTLIGYEPAMEQGFLLDDGRFVRRKSAARIAWEAGQVIRERLIQRGVNPDECPSHLFSEDVW